MNTLQRFSLLLAVLALAPLAITAHAQDGALDASFDRNGIATADFDESIDGAYAVVVQPDGKLVAGGFATLFSLIGNRSFALARFNEDGSLDDSFGTDGRVITDVDGDPFEGNDVIRALALQPDGKIVAVGTAMTRYNPDGSLDSSFGTDGIVRTSAGAVVVQSDGKILIGGGALRRYHTDGSLDTSFGMGGVVPADGVGLVLQPDGKIVTAGSVLRRFHPDGDADLAFGTDGATPLPFDARDLALQPDGGLVIIGQVPADPCGEFGCSDFAVARFNANGSPDLFFGTDGIVTTDFGGGANYPRAVAAQPDGKIVAVGSAFVSFESGITNFALARYTPDGSPDPTFGDNGRVVTDVSHRTDDAYAVALQPDKKIVVAGQIRVTSVPDDEDFALVRYENSSTPDETPPACGPIAFEIDSGLGGPAIVSSATDDVGIASVAFTRLTDNLWGFIGEGDDPDGPYDRGDIVPLGSPPPTSVQIRAVFVEPAGRFSFLVTVTDVSGNQAVCDPIVSDLGATLPEATSLDRPYPNPSHRTLSTPVRVPFALAETAHVRVVVYDLLGREVQTVVNDKMEAGTYEGAFDASSLSSGTYLVRLWTDDGFSQTQRFTVVK